MLGRLGACFIKQRGSYRVKLELVSSLQGSSSVQYSWARCVHATPVVPTVHMKTSWTTASCLTSNYSTLPSPVDSPWWQLLAIPSHSARSESVGRFDTAVAAAPKTKLNFAKRAFYITAPKIWNHTTITVKSS